MAISESVKTLLKGSVDYAGLFPPSALSMSEAVLNYAKYKNSNYEWMLGRFICPVTRLDEFVENAGDFFARDKKGSWQLSVIANTDIFETVRIVEDFNATHGPGAEIDVLELKAGSVDDIAKACEAIPQQISNYFELPLDATLPELVSELAARNQKAKIRTGGVTPDLFPNSREIIRFVRTCLAANIPFKATAGLHHPIRCFKPLTYEANAPKGTMHGFLNLFMTIGFAIQGYKPSLLEEILEEEFEEVFGFDENGVTWQKEHFLNNHQLEILRDKGIHSFGSCSFDEPVADLEEIGIF